MAKGTLKLETTNDISKASKSFDKLKNDAKKADKEIKKSGINVAEELAQKNREKVKELIGRFSAVGIVVGVVAAAIRLVTGSIAKMAESGKAFRDIGQAAGISAESVGHLKAKADAAGISAKEYEKAMDDLKSGKTSLEVLEQTWGNIAEKTKSAEDANAAYAKSLKKNIEDIAVSRDLEKLSSAFSGAMRWVGSRAVRIAGFDSNAESVIENYAQNGLGNKSRDEVIREALQAKTYAPVQGTVRYNALYKEMEALLDRRTKETEQDRQNSRDRQILTLSEGLGGDLQATQKQLADVYGIKMDASEIVKAIERAREKTESLYDRALRLGKDEQAERKAAADKEKKTAAEVDKIKKEASKNLQLDQAFTQGSGLLAGVNYAFGLDNRTIGEQQLEALHQLIDKMTEQLNVTAATNTILSGE